MKLEFDFNKRQTKNIEKVIPIVLDVWKKAYPKKKERIEEIKEHVYDMWFNNSLDNWEDMLHNFIMWGNITPLGLIKTDEEAIKVLLVHYTDTMGTFNDIINDILANGALPNDNYIYDIKQNKFI